MALWELDVTWTRNAHLVDVSETDGVDGLSK